MKNLHKTLSKREENNLLKKTLIIETAINMVEEEGFERFNMKSLAEVSGVPRATLYRYYPGKEELFHDIAVYWGSSFTEGLGKVRKTANLQKAFSQTFSTILKEARNRPELFKLVLSDLFQANLDASDFDNDFAMLFFTMMEKFTSLESHVINKPDLDVLLRLLLANMQLLVSGKISLKDAKRNLDYCVVALMGNTD